MYAIHDLPLNRALDVRALSAIKGGGGGWVFGWIRPFVRATNAFGGVVNLFQTNNFFVADQLNVQLQSITVNNSAPNAKVIVDAAQKAINLGLETS